MKKLLLALFCISLLLAGRIIYATIEINEPEQSPDSIADNITIPQPQSPPFTERYLQKVNPLNDVAMQDSFSISINRSAAFSEISDFLALYDHLTSTKLNQADEHERILLRAEKALERGDVAKTINILHQIDRPEILSENAEQNYYILSVFAYACNHELLKSLLARAALNDYLTDPHLATQNRIVLWRELQSVPLDLLKKELANHHGQDIQGWLQLAVTVVENANNNEALIHALQEWEDQHPKHPAFYVLPDRATLNTLLPFNLPKKIALLLPLNGDFGRMGQAIRDGFMTAFYMNARKIQPAPAIKLYDTSQTHSIVTLYQQAVQEGADFIIGPLTKEDVASLARGSQFPVPTMALNYLPLGQPVPTQLIQFGLSPEQAIRQVAEEAWLFQTMRFLIIASDTEWGHHLTQIFLNLLPTQGGEALDTLYFSDKTQLTAAIASLLHINKSEARNKALEKILKKKVVSLPYRRQDFDGILLIANPAEARQIVPLLNFYFAGNVPTLSISALYEGIPNPEKDHDLNGVYFVEMPWMLSSAPTILTLKQQIQSLWKNNYRTNNRLYALGVDAFTLALTLPRLAAIPNIAVSGTTGLLFLQSNQAIYRKLIWARFSDGIPKQWPA